jgi:hypothetical protein
VCHGFDQSFGSDGAKMLHLFVVEFSRCQILIIQGDSSVLQRDNGLDFGEEANGIVYYEVSESLSGRQPINNFLGGQCPKSVESISAPSEPKDWSGIKKTHLPTPAAWTMKFINSSMVSMVKWNPTYSSRC